MRIILPLLLGLGLTAGAAAASANPGLSQEEDINRGLFAVAVADKIRRACPDISARVFRAYRFMSGLKAEAEKRGYSAAEIDAYINDDAEKAKMRERRNAYFESRGASNLDAASLCELGREEIARGTRAGSLLREN